MREGDALSLPKGWVIKKLKTIGRAQTGTTPPTNDSSNYGDYIPFVKPAHFNKNGEINSKDSGLSETGLSKGRFFDANSVLMVCIGATIGKVGFCTIPVSSNQQINAITPKEDCDYKFLYYGMISQRFQAEVLEIGTSSQATLPIINKSKWENLTLPIPPLQEQQQIVVILDQAFEAIDQAKANIEKNIANAKELFQSKLNAIFSQKGDGWEEKRLQDISIDFGRGKSKNRPRNDKKLFGGDYPFVQTGDIRNTDKILNSYSQTYNEVGLAQSKLWRKGTICITIAANIAETAILNFDSCFPDSMIGLVVDPKKADNDYTYYSLQFLKSKLQALGKGSAQDNINLGTFQNQFFPFPSIDKQKEIVIILDDFAEQAKTLEFNYKQKLNNLEDLKKSILQKAFAGELTNKEVAI
jgi:type I restriction enzyme S subunit